MNNFKNKRFLFFLQCFVGLVFIFSGIAKLFPIHLTELNLVYHHIADWNWSPFLSRILIITEIILGIALCMGISFKKFTLYFALFFTFLLSIYLVVLLINGGNQQDCGCFGGILPMTPIESLIKNGIIISVLVIILKFSHQKTSKLAVYAFMLIAGISGTLILIYFPIYTWLDVNPTIKKTVPFDFNDPISFSNHEIVSLNEGKKLIGVFNMACNNCREVAFKLGIIAKEHNVKNLHLLLVGEYDETDLFISETHLNYPYKRYSFFEFVKLYPHSTWPWIIYSEKGEIKKQWIYETFDVKNFNEQLN